MKRSPIIYFLFFGSGITALVYEIVWTRMLTLVFGHTVFSVSVVLAAFMAGLGFGSYLFGVAIDRMSGPSVDSTGDDLQPGENQAESAHLPLLIYGWIEIGIFVLCGLLSLFLANFSAFYSWIHVWLPDSLLIQNGVKAVLAFTLIFVPTTLMGATLPIISKYYVTDNSKLGRQIGILYGVNTLGAVVGCLLTGFVFISAFGVLQTALAAALLNLFVGISALRIYQDSGGGNKLWVPLPKLSFPTFSFDSDQKVWMGVSLICGFTALAYEVVWTRLLVFSISSTVYSFSMMLAVFLLGIVLGSVLVIPVISRVANLRTVLICLQVGTGLFVIGSLYNMNDLLSAPWNSYKLTDPASAFFRYFKDSSSLMLVPTLFLGMTFPILIKIVSGGYKNIGRATGQIYGSNTLGAILGSLLMGFLILPQWGSQKSLMFIASLNLLLGVLLFLKGSYLSVSIRRGMAAVFAGVILFINIAIPDNLLDRFFMRDSAGNRSINKLLFFEEGLTDTVAVFKDNYGMLDPEAKRLITNGISMSASNVIASRYMKLFAHVPILLLDSPEDVLVVCFGTGQTTGAAAIHPRVRSVDSLELSASVIRAGVVFASENHDALNNPKVNIILQDGRNHLLTTGKKYDVITSEPPPPRTAFTVNLYTKEYYELTKSRLKPGGIVAQWIPLHSQGEKEVAMHFKTFHSVFPHVIAWMSVANEILIIGSDQPIELDFEKLKQRFQEPVIREAMAQIEIENVYSFLSNIWFLENEIEAVAEGYDEITDNRPIIEFYLDLGGTIGRSGIEKYVFNRTPFADIARRITHLSATDRSRLERYYQVMDLYQRGVMYGNRGQLLKALSLVEDNNLIRYHLQAGRNQVARLVKKLERDPNNVEALLNLGHMYYQLGQYQQSADIFEKIPEQAPERSVADLYIGLDLLELGRGDDAKQKFTAVAKKDPRQFRTVMQEIGLVELLKNLSADPDNQGLILSTAQFYNMKKEYLKALDYSLRALDKDPLNEKILQSIVFSYRALGEPGNVLDYATRYRMVDRDNLHLEYILGEMYAKTLRCQKAVPHLESALKKDDTYQNAQKLLDDCHRTLSMRESSISKASSS
ncbi:MAG: fused MFS/spermidine synthase [Nitrospinae bacterium]|nr:fused MFS/spermidine synthase [Nitrospinota bacterium]